MTGALVCAAALILLTAATAVVVTRRRRSPDEPTPEITARRAQEAIRQLERHSRKAGRDTIRGEGGGGNFKTAADAASGTDTSTGV